MKKEIGNIGNYYGMLTAKKKKGLFYWSIKNWDGHRWEEIPESLYKELIQFNDSLKTEAPDED